MRPSRLSMLAIAGSLSFGAVAANASAQMFSGYDAFCGLPVVVYPTEQRAVATFDNFWNPIIVLDPGVMNNWTASRIFALAHECAHHALGHLTPIEQFARHHMNATARQELQADCWAAERLAFAGLYGELTRVVVDFAREPNLPGPYPPGQWRSEVVRQCAGMP